MAVLKYRVDNGTYVCVKCGGVFADAEDNYSVLRDHVCEVDDAQPPALEGPVYLHSAGSIEATLAEREGRYGSFAEHARVTQAIKAAMADSPNWATLAPDQREALEMVAHKAGRILNGDPNFHDSWHDIVGYTKLVADRLQPTDTP